jgi:signal transduction histidine kinase
MASFNETVGALADRETLAARAAALELEAARLEGQTEHAVLEERSRIARELHDVIAHTVSMIVLQAEGAAGLIASDPGRAERALGTIAGAGRQALTELRDLLGVLRRGEHALLGPQPTLDDLDALVDDVRTAGLALELERDLDGAVPAALALSAYRIAQEALTNVIKHAGASQVRIAVRREGSSLLLEVVDDGRAGAARRPSLASGGHGLIGMRERAAAVGGTLEAGPRRDGAGFAVRARLPLKTG